MNRLNVPQCGAGARRGARPSLAASLLLVSGMLLGAGCQAIRMNWAMERLNDRYVRLFSRIENGEDPEAIRESAWDLLETLEEHPIVAFSDEERYRRLLADSRDAAEKIVWQTSEDVETLPALRSRLYQTCNSCHDAYRR